MLALEVQGHVAHQRVEPGRGQWLRRELSRAPGRPKWVTSTVRPPFLAQRARFRAVQPVLARERDTSLLRHGLVGPAIICQTRHSLALLNSSCRCGWHHSPPVAVGIHWRELALICPDRQAEGMSLHKT